MSTDDYETNRFQSERKRRARKEHKCCACHETIRRGDFYIYTTIGDYDGGVGDYKHCLRCSAIADALWKAGAGAIDMTLNCGHTWEENDNLKYPVPDDVAALAFATPEEMQRALGSSPPPSAATPCKPGQ